MVSANILLEGIISEFGRASALIDALEDSKYLHGSERSQSIGTHFRHNVDFASNFLQGSETGKIDYTLRERNLRIEQDRRFAIECIDGLVRRFRDLPIEKLETPVLLRSELDDTIWHSSSLGRELEFIHSHTVHHHALIAQKLKALGIEVPFDFGVAASTLKFWKERDQARTADLSYT